MHSSIEVGCGSVSLLSLLIFQWQILSQRTIYCWKVNLWLVGFILNAWKIFAFPVLVKFRLTFIVWKTIKPYNVNKLYIAISIWRKYWQRKMLRNFLNCLSFHILKVPPFNNSLHFTKITKNCSKLWYQNICSIFNPIWHGLFLNCQSLGEGHRAIITLLLLLWYAGIKLDVCYTMVTKIWRHYYYVIMTS